MLQQPQASTVIAPAAAGLENKQGNTTPAAATTPKAVVQSSDAIIFVFFPTVEFPDDDIRHLSGRSLSSLKECETHLERYREIIKTKQGETWLEKLELSRAYGGIALFHSLRNEPALARNNFQAACEMVLDIKHIAKFLDEFKQRCPHTILAKNDEKEWLEAVAKLKEIHNAAVLEIVNSIPSLKDEERDLYIRRLQIALYNLAGFYYNQKSYWNAECFWTMCINLTAHLQKKTAYDYAKAARLYYSLGKIYDFFPGSLLVTQVQSNYILLALHAINGYEKSEPLAFVKDSVIYQNQLFDLGLKKIKQTTEQKEEGPLDYEGLLLRNLEKMLVLVKDTNEMKKVDAQAIVRFVSEIDGHVDHYNRILTTEKNKYIISFLTQYIQTMLNIKLHLLLCQPHGIAPGSMFTCSDQFNRMSVNLYGQSSDLTLLNSTEKNIKRQQCYESACLLMEVMLADKTLTDQSKIDEAYRRLVINQLNLSLGYTLDDNVQKVYEYFYKAVCNLNKIKNLKLTDFGYFDKFYMKLRKDLTERSLLGFVGFLLTPNTSDFLTLTNSHVINNLSHRQFKLARLEHGMLYEVMEVLLKNRANAELASHKYLQNIKERVRLIILYEKLKGNPYSPEAKEDFNNVPLDITKSEFDVQFAFSAGATEIINALADVSLGGKDHKAVRIGQTIAKFSQIKEPLDLLELVELARLATAVDAKEVIQALVIHAKNETHRQIVLYTALLQAATFNRAHLIKFLLEQGVPLNYYKKINKGSDISPPVVMQLRNEFGFGSMNPLFCAIACGHYDAIEMLLKNGISVHTLNEHGQSPLEMALEYAIRALGQDELMWRNVFKQLLNKGCLLTSKTNFRYQSIYNTLPSLTTFIALQQQVLKVAMNKNNHGVLTDSACDQLFSVGQVILQDDGRLFVTVAQPKFAAQYDHIPTPILLNPDSIQKLMTALRKDPQLVADKLLELLVKLAGKKLKNKKDKAAGDKSLPGEAKTPEKPKPSQTLTAETQLQACKEKLEEMPLRLKAVRDYIHVTRVNARDLSPIENSIKAQQAFFKTIDVYQPQKHVVKLQKLSTELDKIVPKLLPLEKMIANYLCELCTDAMGQLTDKIKCIKAMQKKPSPELKQLKREITALNNDLISAKAFDAMHLRIFAFIKINTAMDESAVRLLKEEVTVTKHIAEVEAAKQKKIDKKNKKKKYAEKAKALAAAQLKAAIVVEPEPTKPTRRPYIEVKVEDKDAEASPSVTPTHSSVTVASEPEPTRPTRPPLVRFKPEVKVEVGTPVEPTPLVNPSSSSSDTDESETGSVKESSSASQSPISPLLQDVDLPPVPPLQDEIRLNLFSPFSPLFSPAISMRPYSNPLSRLSDERKEDKESVDGRGLSQREGRVLQSTSKALTGSEEMDSIINDVLTTVFTESQSEHKGAGVSGGSPSKSKLMELSAADKQPALFEQLKILQSAREKKSSSPSSMPRKLSGSKEAKSNSLFSYDSWQSNPVPLLKHFFTQIMNKDDLSAQKDSVNQLLPVLQSAQSVYRDEIRILLLETLCDKRNNPLEFITRLHRHQITATLLPELHEMLNRPNIFNWFCRHLTTIHEMNGTALTRYAHIAAVSLAVIAGGYQTSFGSPDSYKWAVIAAQTSQSAMVLFSEEMREKIEEYLKYTYSVELQPVLKAELKLIEAEIGQLVGGSVSESEILPHPVPQCSQ